MAKTKFVDSNLQGYKKRDYKLGKDLKKNLKKIKKNKKVITLITETCSGHDNISLQIKYKKNKFHIAYSLDLMELVIDGESLDSFEDCMNKVEKCKNIKEVKLFLYKLTQTGIIFA